jgi:hypothetical protein
VVLIGEHAALGLRVDADDTDLGMHGHRHPERVEARAEIRRGRRDANRH